jgi:peptidoglycan L-alanyl-D-glutamate endopeptidase CwlK
MSKTVNDLHPYVKYLHDIVTAKWKAAGLHPTDTSFVRTMQEQADIYASGRTKRGPILTYTKPGYSMHNYGLAWDTSFPTDAEYRAAAKIAKAEGLTWGGEFKLLSGKPFVDRPHFQWTGGLTTKDLLAGKRPENPLEMTVKTFQKAFGLESDGIVGPITKAKMQEVLTLINKYVKGE